MPHTLTFQCDCQASEDSYEVDVFHGGCVMLQEDFLAHQYEMND